MYFFLYEQSLGRANSVSHSALEGMEYSSVSLQIITIIRHDMWH